MKFLYVAILMGIALTGFAQNFSLTGTVFADDGSPLVYSSVVLLNPADSTMQAFGITNKEGNFDIKNIKKGNYLLQAAFLGYETHYQPVAIPVEGNKLGAVVLKTKPLQMDEVQVSGEYVPLAIKNDTVEYNAAAFKLRPDAVTEDLLKKLPGIEVDRAGNITAMGEDVKKLYVDGKEFFGNDPTVATKNVPADAVDKVQVYNRKSDQSMFTGIDDGSRDKAINLQLKEDKKNALFGDVMAGAGTNNRWQGGAKAYRFTDKIQVAALGMANNINQFGFSFNDYMNFSGGIGQMMHGGGSASIRITSDGSFPINFGEPVAGLNTAGAGGANFSYSTSPNDRVFISYFGSGSKKDLEQSTLTRNFVEGDKYEQTQELDETDKDQAHRFNLGWRNRIDSTQNIIADGNFAISSGSNNRKTFVESWYNGTQVNRMNDLTVNNSERISGSGNASYMKKMGSGKTVFEAGGILSLSQGLTENDIQTETEIFNPTGVFPVKQFQNDRPNDLRYSVNTSLSRFLGKGSYLIPSISAGNDIEELDRTQGIPGNPELVTDSLSPEFQKKYSWLKPKLTYKYTAGKTSLTFGLQLESGKMQNTLNGTEQNSRIYNYLLPNIWYEYQFQTGRRAMLSYNSGVNTPSVTQLLPVINNINPLSQFLGNPDLKPEITHSFNLHYILFDQFSFTSLMAAFSGSYTKDKINWKQTVNQNLVKINTLENFDNDVSMRGNIDFSTPIKKLGMKVNFNIEESWSRGFSMINNVENEYTGNSTRASLSFDNRKKEKWDVNTGVEATLSNSRYSVQNQTSNRYFDLKWFGEARYTPNDTWDFEVNTDFTNYFDKTFPDSQKIPLLGAQVSYFFLKNKRSTLAVKGFDLLNRNQIVQRFGELNYLREIRSNSIGRFVMLSFTYRLNKFGGQSNGIEVKMRR
jgi:hypothetical protein